jgi:hypothetical protein
VEAEVLALLEALPLLDQFQRQVEEKVDHIQEEEHQEDLVVEHQQDHQHLLLLEQEFAVKEILAEQDIMIQLITMVVEVAEEKPLLVVRVELMQVEQEELV